MGPCNISSAAASTFSCKEASPVVAEFRAFLGFAFVSHATAVDADHVNDGEAHKRFYVEWAIFENGKFSLKSSNVASFSKCNSYIFLPLHKCI